MGTKRLSMRKIREVLRLKHELGLENRQIAKCCRISHVSVGNCLTRFTRAGLSWPLGPEWDDGRLSNALFGVRAERQPGRELPSLIEIHRELRRPGVTLQLLWEEYRANHPGGYGYSQFCEHYRRFARKLDPVLRQEHRAGERMFTDFAGPTIPVHDPRTGEITLAHLFVAVLGASNYTFATATRDQGLEEWLLAHVEAFEYFGGTPQIVVPDNLKAAVSRACRYEPELNPSYAELARHYGTAVIPARPYKARDKAKVEAGVLVVERWIMAALRNRKFLSLAELNAAIRVLLERLNNRPFKKLPGSRASWFREIEAPALRPLPEQRYEFCEWIRAGVNIDYHVAVREHHYSVPHSLVNERVEVRLTARTVEILHRGQRVAAHPRSFVPGGTTTIEAHRPKAHQRHLAWTPGRIIRWAQSVGVYTAAAVQSILESKPHPEQGYRSCLGILRLAKGYGPERVEAACRRALTGGVCSYRSIKSILAAKLDSQPLPQPEETTPAVQHDNVRGRGYYH